MRKFETKLHRDKTALAYLVFKLLGVFVGALDAFGIWKVYLLHFVFAIYMFGISISEK